jgi:hypothetical protein
MLKLPNDQDVLLTPDVLQDTEFQSGFADGIEAYESDVEERGRSLTTVEACREIRKECSHESLLCERAFDASFGVSAQPTLHWTGFLAGWLSAHAADVRRQFTSPSQPTNGKVLTFSRPPHSELL